MAKIIPGPPGYPIVGNVFDIRNEVPINGLVDLANKYGSIYKKSIFGNEFVVVSDCEMLGEICDETRFGKVLP